jgi:hypothetical protein
MLNGLQPGAGGRSSGDEWQVTSLLTMRAVIMLMTTSVVTSKLIPFPCSVRSAKDPAAYHHAAAVDGSFESVVAAARCKVWGWMCVDGDGNDDVDDDAFGDGEGDSDCDCDGYDYEDVDADGDADADSDGDADAEADADADAEAKLELHLSALSVILTLYQGFRELYLQPHLSGSHPICIS